jgi:hypothetical protein
MEHPGKFDVDREPDPSGHALARVEHPCLGEGAM